MYVQAGYYKIFQNIFPKVWDFGSNFNSLNAYIPMKSYNKGLGKGLWLR